MLRFHQWGLEVRLILVRLEALFLRYYLDCLSNLADLRLRQILESLGNLGNLENLAVLLGLMALDLLLRPVALDCLWLLGFQ